MYFNTDTKIGPWFRFPISKPAFGRTLIHATEWWGGCKEKIIYFFPLEARTIILRAPLQNIFQRPILHSVDIGSRNGFWKAFENAIFSIYILLILLWFLQVDVLLVIKVEITTIILTSPLDWIVLFMIWSKGPMTLKSELMMIVQSKVNLWHYPFWLKIRR